MTVAVFAPATVANVGPGFDCFGFAVEGVGLGDVVEVEVVDEPGIRIVEIESRDDLPDDPGRNTAAVAAQHAVGGRGARGRADLARH